MQTATRLTMQAERKSRIRHAVRPYLTYDLEADLGWRHKLRSMGPCRSVAFLMYELQMALEKTSAMSWVG
jgi:hypothetical protein